MRPTRKTTKTRKSFLDRAEACPRCAASRLALRFDRHAIYNDRAVILYCASCGFFEAGRTRLGVVTNWNLYDRNRLWLRGLVYSLTHPLHVTRRCRTERRAKA